MEVLNHHHALVPIDVRVNSQKLFAPRAPDASDHLVDQLLILIPTNPVLAPAFGKVRCERSRDTQSVAPDGENRIGLGFARLHFTLGRRSREHDRRSGIITRSRQHIPMQLRRIGNLLEHRIDVRQHRHEVTHLQLAASQGLRFFDKDRRQLIWIIGIIETPVCRFGDLFQNGHIAVMRKHGHRRHRNLRILEGFHQWRRWRRSVAIGNNDHMAAGSIRIFQCLKPHFHCCRECPHIADCGIVNERHQFGILRRRCQFKDPFITVHRLSHRSDKIFRIQNLNGFLGDAFRPTIALRKLTGVQNDGQGTFGQNLLVTDLHGDWQSVRDH